MVASVQLTWFELLDSNKLSHVSGNTFSCCPGKKVMVGYLNKHVFFMVIYFILQLQMSNSLLMVGSLSVPSLPDNNLLK